MVDRSGLETSSQPTELTAELAESLPAPSPTWRVLVRLLRWHKPAGRLILLVPALWALVLASAGNPPVLLLAIITLGSFVASAMGCVVNDLWDRNIDPHVERTRHRPIASRELSVKTGIVVLVLALFCALGLALFLSPLSFVLCAISVPVIAVYPLAKRSFPCPQLILALAWGFAVLIPWSTLASLDLPAWLLWGAVVFWTLGFDTVYALADREDDRRIGVNSSALFLGRWTERAIGGFYATTALLLAAVGWSLSLAWPYWLAWAIAVAAWGHQTWQLVRSQASGITLSRSAFGKLFADNVLIGFVLLAGMTLGCWLA